MRCTLHWEPVLHNMKPVIGIISRGGEGRLETHCLHKNRYSFCTNGPISKVLTALKSWDSRACDGLIRNIKFQVSNVQNWARMWKKRFWSLFPDPLFFGFGLQSQVQIDFSTPVFFSSKFQGISRGFRCSDPGSRISCKNCATRDVLPPLASVSRYPTS